MEEIWKDVVGYEGLYEVSNYGRVRSCEFVLFFKSGRKEIRPPRILRQNTDRRKDFYFFVRLSKEGKKKLFLIHRLVAEAFIPNPNNYPCVNHKDECKHNNFVFVNTDGSIDESKSNLEWCTYSYNTTYGTAIKRMLESRKRTKLRKKLLSTI